jgi:hypothetical protein
MTASELHTASGEWLSNVFLALAKFAVRQPKTGWVPRDWSLINVAVVDVRSEFLEYNCPKIKYKCPV